MSDWGSTPWDGAGKGKKKGVAASAAGEGGDGADKDDARPVVRVANGKLHEAVDAAERVLIEAGPGPIFQRAGELVHIVSRPARRVDRPAPKAGARIAKCASANDSQEEIKRIGQAALLRRMGELARFEKFDVRAAEWRAIDPPRKLAEDYFELSQWKLPDLHHLIATPTLRADGSLLASRGYDPATGLYLTDELSGLDVPDRPTSRQAEEANDLLVGMFATFPFDDGVSADDGGASEGLPGRSLSVALAGLIGTLLRPTLPAAPLIAVTAPESGTGKSYLVDLISVIATGRRAVAVATGSGPEEFEKSLGAALLSGRPLLVLDNMVQPLAGQLLCLAITQERVDIRVLGLTKMVMAPTAAAIFATGNNLRVRDDMSRRVLLCRMDAKLERPEEREFEHNLLAEAELRRAELVSAGLTIARWHSQQRDPRPLLVRHFAGFDAWCHRVRDALVALGHADPVASLDETRATDLDARWRRAVVEAWAARFGDRDMTCQEVIHLATHIDSITGALTMPDLNEALIAIAGDRTGRLNPRRLGNYLAQHEGRRIGGRCFKRSGTKKRALVWVLEASAIVG